MLSGVKTQGLVKNDIHTTDTPFELEPYGNFYTPHSLSSGGINRNL